MAVGRADRDAAKADFVARVLTGMAYGDVASAGRLYAQRVVEGKLRPTTVARLRWHQREGHEVVIVSASLDTYLHEVARLLGVASVLCTTLEVDQHGFITGRLVGGNCRGPEKVSRLAAHLNASATHVAPLVWAYGDSSGDDELLALADRATRVARSGRLVEATPGR
jgi:HAD superfamily hydrolase (TIGR01490 family)